MPIRSAEEARNTHNAEIADTILKRVRRGEGVSLVNKNASSEDVQNLLREAGYSNWILSYPGNPSAGCSQWRECKYSSVDLTFVQDDSGKPKHVTISTRDGGYWFMLVPTRDWVGPYGMEQPDHDKAKKILADLKLAVESLEKFLKDAPVGGNFRKAI